MNTVRAAVPHDYLAELMQLTNAHRRHECDMYITTCARCGETQNFCRSVRIQEDGTDESWCMKCVGIVSLQKHGFRKPAGAPLMNLNPPPAPVSPWGTNK